MIYRSRTPKYGIIMRKPSGAGIALGMSRSFRERTDPLWVLSVL
jgi:hypothetical protein